MRYEDSAAFRRALEERLRQQAVTAGTPLARLRKMIAFERFLARLVTAQPDAWVLKGGLALQFRLRERARTTQDIDLLWRQSWPPEDIHHALVTAALLDMKDWFTFETARPTLSTGLRFSVQSLLDGRLF
ncbi:MAG: nucleotidyl transferase AbiEii/AbiGii toxin family protein [Anaerolineales bacterium]